MRLWDQRGQGWLTACIPDGASSPALWDVRKKSAFRNLKQLGLVRTILVLDWRTRDYCRGTSQTAWKYYRGLHRVKWGAFSCVQLFATHGLQSMEFSRLEILEWVPFSFSGFFPMQGLNQVSLIADRFFTSWATREAQGLHKAAFNYFKHGNDSVRFVLRIPSLYVFVGWVTGHTWGTSYKKSRQDIMCAWPESRRGPKARVF